jgi:predicted NUDIX family NTP pyrophosphohydrolase
VLCWAVEGDLNPESITSNVFEIEWPPRSGKMKSFPEVDKAGWFGIEEATQLINEKQIPFLEELSSKR